MVTKWGNRTLLSLLREGDIVDLYLARLSQIAYSNSNMLWGELDHASWLLTNCPNGSNDRVLFQSRCENDKMNLLVFKCAGYQCRIFESGWIPRQDILNLNHWVVGHGLLEVKLNQRLRLHSRSPNLNNATDISCWEVLMLQLIHGNDHSNQVLVCVVDLLLLDLRGSHSRLDALDTKD